MSEDQLSPYCASYQKAIEIVGRRWTGAILRALISGSCRFGQIAGAMPGVSDRLISERLKEREAAGWRVIPVNPNADEIAGEKAYASLADVPEPIDVVEVFRPAAEAPRVTREAIAAGAKAVWLQLGIESSEARAIARDAGIDYV